MLQAVPQVMFVVHASSPTSGHGFSSGHTFSQPYNQYTHPIANAHDTTNGHVNGMEVEVEEAVEVLDGFASADADAE
jgi:hypothetical protein